MKTLWVGSLLWTSLAFAAEPGEIPMLGLSDAGSPVEIAVPVSAYKDKLTKAVVALQSSTLSAIQKEGERSREWMLRTIVVGLGVKIEVGLGPVVKFGVLPRFGLVFTNSKEPSVP